MRGVKTDALKGILPAGRATVLARGNASLNVVLIMVNVETVSMVSKKLRPPVSHATATLSSDVTEIGVMQPSTACCLAKWRTGATI